MSLIERAKERFSQIREKIRERLAPTPCETTCEVACQETCQITCQTAGEVAPPEYSLTITVTPTQVEPGDIVTVEGDLLHNGMGVPGAYVDVNADTTVSRTAVTDEGGHFRVRMFFSEPGTYRVRASYRADSLTVVSNEVTVTVIAAPCTATCEVSCQAGCETVCQETCEVVRQICTSTCELTCQTTAQAAPCTSLCETSCQAQCELSCQAVCEVAAQAPPGCFDMCETSCQATCELYCQSTSQTGGPSPEAELITVWIASCRASPSEAASGETVRLEGLVMGRWRSPDGSTYDGPVANYPVYVSITSSLTGTSSVLVSDWFYTDGNGRFSVTFTAPERFDSIYCNVYVYMDQTLKDTENIVVHSKPATLNVYMNADNSPVNGWIRVEAPFFESQQGPRCTRSLSLSVNVTPNKNCTVRGYANYCAWVLDGTKEWYLSREYNPKPGEVIDVPWNIHTPRGDFTITDVDVRFQKYDEAWYLRVMAKIKASDGYELRDDIYVYLNGDYVGSFTTESSFLKRVPVQEGSRAEVRLETREIGCPINGKLTWSNTYTVGCEATCEVSCQVTCEQVCQAACEETCQTACEAACETEAEAACTEQCEVLCQTGCEVACEQPCQVSCMAACETSCQEVCEVSVQVPTPHLTFSSDVSSVRPNEDFRVSGRLYTEYMGATEPIPNKGIIIKARDPTGDTSILGATPYTNSDGYYSAYVHLPSLYGTWSLWAETSVEGQLVVSNAVSVEVIREECTAACETSCQSACELSCQATCQLSCQTSCEVECQEACQWSCQETCQVTCQKACQVTCQEACEVSCQETCQVACQKACEVSCQTACELNPTCETACQEKCEVTCMTTCEKSCQTGCENVCQVGCEVSCQATCELSCEETCEISCQSYCEWYCETASEVQYI